MILSARIIGDTLGIASAAQQRQADAVLQLIRQGMSRERAHAKISGRWGDIRPPAPEPAATPAPAAHPAIRTALPLPEPPPARPVAKQGEHVAILSSAAIRDACAAALGVSVYDMTGPGRTFRSSKPRQVVASLCIEYSGQAQSVIAAALGCKDASSISVADRKTRARIAARCSDTTRLYDIALGALLARYPDAKPLPRPGLGRHVVLDRWEP